MQQQLGLLRDFLSLEYIGALADQDAQARARRIFREGGVFSIDKTLEGFTCRVSDGDLYLVTLGRDGCRCSCGTAACAHRPAALLALRGRMPGGGGNAPLDLAGFREALRCIPAARAVSPAISAAFDLRGLSLRESRLTLSLRVGSIEPQAMVSIGEFLKSWQTRSACRLGEGLTYDPQTWRFSAPYRALFLALAALVDEERLPDEGRSLVMPGRCLARLLAPLAGETVSVRLGENEESLTIDPHLHRLGYLVDDDGNGGFSITPRLVGMEDSPPLAPSQLRILPGSPGYAVCGSRLLRLDDNDAAALAEIARGGHPLPEHFPIPRDEADAVLQEWLPEFAERGPLVYAGRMRNAVREKEGRPRPILKIDMAGEDVSLRLFFRYGSRRVEWHVPGRLVRLGDYSWLVRRLRDEQEVLGKLTDAGFRGDADGVLVLQNELLMFHFIYEVLPAHREEWDVLYNSSSRVKTRRLGHPKVGVRMARRQDFLEVSIAPRERDVRIDPAAVLAAASREQPYVRLKDGQFLPLSEEQRTLLAGLASRVPFRTERRGNGTVLAADGIFVPLVAETIEAAPGAGCEIDPAVFEYSRNIVQWNRRIAPPAGLSATLRSYQQDGLTWLDNIRVNGLGGVLADDMGLGKTLQTLAMVLHAVNQGEPDPFLIVCPSSLVFNWVNEARRFAPALSVLALSGGVRERAARLFTIPEHHLVVVSYALLQRDEAELSRYRYAAVILDEAQHIKNPGSGRTISAKAIQARSRFALTGTPIENSLGELWSLFDFVLPGYLFDYRRFRDEVERPACEGRDASVLPELKRKLAPFMLRRTKDQVLKQLPKKSEQVFACEMSREQRSAYLSVLAFFDTRLLPLLERDGISPHALEVLAALTRLRQICCHPGSVMEEYRQASSGKLDLLMEILNEALDGGHKALVFSQFTGMLDLVEARLAEEGMVSLRLDGGTPVRKREGLVTRFNGDPGVFCFLISLKAGGTGLNLTAADTVIHVDPWWNPAVEEQASARAWRMGQTRAVNVYKLIAAQSVEEKILALQREKKRLFDAVVGDGDGSVSRLSLEQVRDLFRA